MRQRIAMSPAREHRLRVPEGTNFITIVNNTPHAITLYRYEVNRIAANVDLVFPAFCAICYPVNTERGEEIYTLVWGGGGAADYFDVMLTEEHTGIATAFPQVDTGLAREMTLAGLIPAMRQSHGEHGNGWNNTTVAANEITPAIELFGPHVTAWGVVSGTTSGHIFPHWSQNGTNWLAIGAIAIAATTNFDYRITAAFRFIRFQVSVATTITLTCTSRL